MRACARLSGVRARQFLGEELLSGKDRLRVEMRNAAAPFERFEGDTGSSEVQGAQSYPKGSSRLQHKSKLGAGGQMGSSYAVDFSGRGPVAASDKVRGMVAPLCCT